VRAILDDADAAVVLTEAVRLDEASAAASGRIVVPVREREGGGADVMSVRPHIEPDDAAYILYTSGSSGRPKGVVQSHRGVLGHIETYANTLAIGARDRLGLLASFATDAAVMDIFGALLTGATLCPLDLRILGLDGAARALAALQVTIYHSTPTVFRALAPALSTGEALSQARCLVFGGESLRRADVEMALRLTPPGCELVNGLGPTECTVALQEFVDRDAPIGRETVPVGFPVEGVEVDLVTADDTAVIGVGAGEIVLRSERVALGYWRAPEATGAAFLPDPAGGRRRRYRTGDLGRRLADGRIEFRGRRDAQVKIRGVRVEPGEVEARLREHPAVRDAAVRAVSGPSETLQLVAWIEPRDGHDVDVRAVRDHLRHWLPPPMVPAHVLVAEAFPRTPSGKLDRLALPAPDLSRPPTEGADVLSDEEATLAAVWDGLLARSPQSPDEDFFAMGGDSLLAMRLVSRLRTLYGVEFPLQDVFDAPTLSAMSARLLAVRAAADAPGDSFNSAPSAPSTGEHS
jgi:amino acid adenylation domain-containing protein